MQAADTPAACDSADRIREDPLPVAFITVFNRIEFTPYLFILGSALRDFVGDANTLEQVE